MGALVPEREMGVTPHWLVNGRQSTGGEYINLHQNIVSKYIYILPIFDIAMENKRLPVSPTIIHWWEQDGTRFGNEVMGTENLDVDRK